MLSYQLQTDLPGVLIINVTVTSCVTSTLTLHHKNLTKITVKSTFISENLDAGF